MLQRAEEKRAMQRMVIAGGGDISDSFMKSNAGHDMLTQSEMVSLLLDDEELAKR